MPLPNVNKAALSGFEAPEVQNKGISGPTKRTYILQNYKKKSQFKAFVKNTNNLKILHWLIKLNLNEPEKKQKKNQTNKKMSWYHHRLVCC